MFKAIVTACVLFALPASAEGMFRSQQPVQCGTTKGVTASLEGKYGERLLIQATNADGSMVQIFVSPAGTLTVLHTVPVGVSCLVAVGKDIEVMEAPKRITPNPASFTEL